MTHIVFFEKPGCGGNAKQKAMLTAAGHTLDVRSLLAEPWTRESLLAFLDPLPVEAWFNRAAPKVRDGLVKPETLDREQALALMLAEPLLIRRPLMEVDGQRLVGFDAEAVDAFVGLAPRADGAAPKGNLEGCAASSVKSCDPV
ncbi:ArsC/Spx/MgsR family protein [Derxia gummosa]|uniref:ArsC/Spx/MgsR family protein n=1 Tax=Derxia gummosa DSM 723 TaxID=1121388 RepID=A0A8B6X1S3_9BURK|nr:ArsC/Spx/MgsR family protein [Derxia gummosa]